jgi:hypothetical protein
LSPRKSRVGDGLYMRQAGGSGLRHWEARTPSQQPTQLGDPSNSLETSYLGSNVSGHLPGVPAFMSAAAISLGGHAPMAWSDRIEALTIKSANVALT